MDRDKIKSLLLQRAQETSAMNYKGKKFWTFDIDEAAVDIEDKYGIIIDNELGKEIHQELLKLGYTFVDD
jgi:hypothetical protein